MPLELQVVQGYSLVCPADACVSEASPLRMVVAQQTPLSRLTVGRVELEDVSSPAVYHLGLFSTTLESA